MKGYSMCCVSVLFFLREAGGVPLDSVGSPRVLCLTKLAACFWLESKLFFQQAKQQDSIFV